MISFQEILLVLSDSRTMDLFKVVGSTTANGNITNVHLTRKQYYTRMSGLMKTGLIQRKKGKYYLTTLGKIVHDSLLNVQSRIEYALTNIWKLKAIDSLAAYEQPSKEELEKIIDALLDNNDIKRVIIKDEYSAPHDLIAGGIQKVKIKTGVSQT
jgi:predicted transcriptional regulator